jgi:type VI protein secretion system component Hcp
MKKYEHEIFTRENFATRKFCNTKISRYTVDGSANEDISHCSEGMTFSYSSCFIALIVLHTSMAFGAKSWSIQHIIMTSQFECDWKESLGFR